MRRSALLAVATLLTAGLAAPLTGQQGSGDPYFASSNSWGQGGEDQWALKRVKLPEAAALVGGTARPVLVAVIDTGLDWNHADLGWDRIWTNPGEVPGNGIDDDGNGYVDDLIGWDFFARSNNPWDYDGHGTFIAGMIAAKSNNGIGISGASPHARIMVVKAVNNFGKTRASFVAQGIKYAVDNGARVINLSVGGNNFTDIERAALDYAEEKGVLVVAAAGNEAADIADYAPAGYPTVLAVGSSDRADKRANFSNYGAAIDLVAPGLDILSLRARRTDTMLNIAGEGYTPGKNVVGADRRYYWASGTSFSAPLVTAAASLLLAKNPALKARDLRRILTYSARDVDAPGVDQYTGYGLLDAAAAMATDPGAFIEAQITGVTVGQANGGPAAIVTGTAAAGSMTSAVIELGKGESPSQWTGAVTIAQPVEDGQLAAIPATSFAGGQQWTLRLVVTDGSGEQRESRYLLNLQ